MSIVDSSLRLRPWASLLLFLSSYSPLILILIIKDYDPISPNWLPRNPVICGFLLFVAIASSAAILHSMREISGGLPVVVTKAANKSGDMFWYTIPYMLSFLKVDLGDWQTITGLLILLSILLVMVYRTQTVFVNPILAIAGYMLIDTTFKRGDHEVQAMVVTRAPLLIGKTYQMERLSHYLYVAVVQNESKQLGGCDE